MLENHRHILPSLRGKPFSAALNGPLPCRPPPDPLQDCLFLLSGPERKLNGSVSGALNGSALGSGGEKSQAEPKAGAPRRYGVKEQGHLRFAA
jgi:hypothetical protein